MEWYLMRTKSDGSMSEMRTGAIEDIQEVEVLVSHPDATMIEDGIADQVEIVRSTVRTIRIVIDTMTAVETMMTIDVGDDNFIGSTLVNRTWHFNWRDEWMAFT
jgi:hypothetical protein